VPNKSAFREALIYSVRPEFIEGQSRVFKGFDRLSSNGAE
jgi:hypothetical protein